MFEICVYKKRYDNNFFSPLSFVEVFGLGILIRDPGSRMGKNSGSRIRAPGSATLHYPVHFSGVGDTIFHSPRAFIALIITKLGPHPPVLLQCFLLSSLNCANTSSSEAVDAMAERSESDVNTLIHSTFLGPKWPSPFNGWLQFHRALKRLDFQGPTSSYLPS